MFGKVMDNQYQNFLLLLKTLIYFNHLQPHNQFMNIFKSVITLPQCYTTFTNLSYYGNEHELPSKSSHHKTNTSNRKNIYWVFCFNPKKRITFDVRNSSILVTNSYHIFIIHSILSTRCQLLLFYVSYVPRWSSLKIPFQA